MNNIPTAKNVQQYYEHIFGLAIGGANGAEKFFKKESVLFRKKKNHERWMNILFEYTFFYIHYTDRFLFENFDNEKRATILGEIVEGLITLILKTFFENTSYVERINMGAELNMAFNDWTTKYGEYKNILPRKGDDLKGTLIWEFSKRIAELTEGENRMLCITITSMTIPEAIKLTDISGFIDNIKSQY